MAEETGDIQHHHHEGPRHRKGDPKRPKRWYRRAGAAVSFLAAGIGGGHQVSASAAEVASQVTETRPAAHTRVLTAQEALKNPLADVRKGLEKATGAHSASSERSLADKEKAFADILKANDIASQDLAPKLNDTQLAVAVQQAKTEGTLIDAKLTHQTIWHQYRAAGMTEAQADLACRLAARASEHDKSLNKNREHFSENRMNDGDNFDTINTGVLALTSAFADLTPEQIGNVVKSLSPEQQLDFLKITKVANRNYKIIPRVEQLKGDRAALEVVLEGAHRYHEAAQNPQVQDFLQQLYKAKTSNEQARVLTDAANSESLRLFLGTARSPSGIEETPDTGTVTRNDQGHSSTERSSASSTVDTSNATNSNKADLPGVRQIDVPSFADKAKMFGQDALEKTENILKIIGKGALGLGGALLTLEVFGWARRKDRRIRHRRQEEYRRDAPAGWGQPAERRVNPDDPQAHLALQRVRDHEEATEQRQVAATIEDEEALQDAARLEADESAARRREAAGGSPAAPAPEPPPLPPVGEQPAAPAPEPPPLPPVGEQPAAPAPEPPPLPPVGEQPAAPAPELEVPYTDENQTEIQIAKLLREHPFIGEMDSLLEKNQEARYLAINNLEELEKAQQVLDKLPHHSDFAQLSEILDGVSDRWERGEKVQLRIGVVQDASTDESRLEIQEVPTFENAIATLMRLSFMDKFSSEALKNGTASDLISRDINLVRDIVKSMGTLPLKNYEMILNSFENAARTNPNIFLQVYRIFHSDTGGDEFIARIIDKSNEEERYATSVPDTLPIGLRKVKPEL